MPTLKITGDARGAIRSILGVTKAFQGSGKAAQTATSLYTAAANAAKKAGITGTAAEKSHAAAIRRNSRLLRAKVADLHRANRAASGAGSTMGRLGSMFSRGFSVSGIAGTIASFVGLSAAIAAVAREWEKVKEFENERSTAQLDLAIVEGQLRQNISGASPAVRERVLSSIPQIAQATQHTPEDIFRAMTEVVSATGDPRRSIGTVELAAKYTRDPRQLAPIGGGIGDIQGKSSEVSTPEAALAILAAVQQKARLTDVATTATKLAPVVAAYEAAGAGVRQAAAEFAAISQAIGDRYGDVTRTTAINLVPSLKKFFEKSEYRSAVYAPEDRATHAQRVELLKGDDALAREYLAHIEEKGEFRAQGRTGVTSYFGKNTGTHKETIRIFDETMDLLNRPDDALKQLAEDNLKFVREGPLQRKSRIEGGIKNATQLLALDSEGDLSVDASNRLVQFAAEATKTPFSAVQAESSKYGPSFSVQEAQEFAMEQLLRGVADRKRAVSTGRVRGFGSTAPATAAERFNTEDDQFLALEKLQEMVNLMIEEKNDRIRDRQEAVTKDHNKTAAGRVE